MRGFFTSIALSCLLSVGALATAASVRAQDGQTSPGEGGPSVIDPDTLPGVPFPQEDMPNPEAGPPGPAVPPLGDTPPMVVPPPGGGDDGDGPGPEAFGSPPPTSDPAMAEPDPKQHADETPAQRLDRLFAELKKAPTHGEAAPIAARIQREWARSGSATVDLMMQRAAEAMAKKDNAAAMDVLDQAIVLAPAFAEAWNRRATLNFTIDDWGKSLADIEQTLIREPRHWGAMMGLGAILEETGHKDKAFETYMQVLSVYPALKSAQEAAGRLADELTGPEI